MFESIKALVLRFARVPAEPHPPLGTPGSIRVFRASPNYWKYLMVIWAIRQLFGAIALVVVLAFSWNAVNAVRDADDLAVITHDGKVQGRIRGAALRPYARLIHLAELAGLTFFVAQVPLSLAAARLDYELRWYMVTDRSLRLREGIFRVREMTLTFANVQNISIRQGPLQRLLGISDVVVQTAGGGGSPDAHGHDAHGPGASMHTGLLRAVDNGEQVRDLILDRLRRLRDAGLGDPDDRHAPAAPPTARNGADVAALTAAARELLDEARALRAAFR